jgi:hypothetical protein
MTKRNQILLAMKNHTDHATDRTFCARLRSARLAAIVSERWVSAQSYDDEVLTPQN